MPIEQCPHCFRQVLPTKDRRCPACSELIDSGPTDERAGSELIWLGKATRLPSICVRCGRSTDETVRLQTSSVSRARAFFGNLDRPLFAVIALFRPELVVDDADAYRMVRTIHCCGICKESNRPTIHATDHHTYRIGILVKRDIARLLRTQGANGNRH